METILKKDLKKANKKISKDLLDLSDSISKVTSSIDNFVTGTTKDLKGRGYDAVRKKLSGFSLALDRLSTTLSNSSQDLSNANNSVSSAMEGVSKASYSKEMIDDLTNRINRMKVEDYLFYTGKEETPLEYRQAYKRALESYSSIKKSLEEKLELLVKIKAAVDSKSSVPGEIVSSFSKDKSNIDALSISNVK